MESDIVVETRIRVEKTLLILLPFASGLVFPICFLIYFSLSNFLCQQHVEGAAKLPCCGIIEYRI